MKRFLIGVVAGLFIVAAGAVAQEASVAPTAQIIAFLGENGVSGAAATSGWEDLSTAQRLEIVALNADEEIRGELNSLVFGALHARLAQGDVDVVQMITAGTTWTMERGEEE